ncbi:MAG: hypothetical protein ACK559_17920, partial [bacterium]
MLAGADHDACQRTRRIAVEARDLRQRELRAWRHAHRGPQRDRVCRRSARGGKQEAGEHVQAEDVRRGRHGRVPSPRGNATVAHQKARMLEMFLSVSLAAWMTWLFIS